MIFSGSSFIYSYFVDRKIDLLYQINHEKYWKLAAENNIVINVVHTKISLSFQRYFKHDLSQEQ